MTTHFVCIWSEEVQYMHETRSHSLTAFVPCFYGIKRTFIIYYHGVWHLYILKRQQALSQGDVDPLQQ